MLFGEVNPSGKLPVTIARSVGQLPVYYSQKAISFYKDYLDEEAGPLYPFGFGLSYTTFEYSCFKVEKPFFGLNETINLSVTVKNSGMVSGSEVVQLYAHDKVATVVRPGMLLVRFEKIFLDPGEERNIRFTLFPQKDLSFTGMEMRRVVEPGMFELMVGRSSEDIRERAIFELR